MKNKFKLIVCVSFMLVLFASCNQKQDKPTKKATGVESKNVTTEEDKQKKIEEYEQNIKGVKEIKVKELDEVSAGKEITVYLGRKTCPDCQKFSKVFKPFVSKYEIYYIDSVAGIKKSPEDLKKFRTDNDIKTVPAVFRVKDGKITDRMNIDDKVGTTPEELQKFLDKK